MGIFRLDNPGRCGFEAAKYDGWYMANIINDFADSLDLDSKLLFRKALLVSYEAQQLQTGGRINV